MSSVSDVIVSGSALRLVTTTLNVNWPPGSGSEAGVAVLSTAMIGRTSVRVTTASSVSVASLPSSSSPVTVTVSVWLSPALPVKLPVNEQL